MSSPYISFATLYKHCQNIDEETFFDATMGAVNKHGSVHYISIKYNKNFEDNSKKPHYIAMWGYVITPDDGVTFDGISSRADKSSGKVYLTGSIPKDGNDAHTLVSDMLVRSIINALKRCLDNKTTNLQGKALLTKILNHSDFPSITFKPHYSETFVSKETGELEPMKHPRAVFEFDSSSWSNSNGVPVDLQGKIRSRIYTLATAADVEVMKEHGMKVANKIEKYLPNDDDDEEEAKMKFNELCKCGRIPHEYDPIHNKPAKVIGGTAGRIFGEINFPGTLQIFGGSIRLKPSFGACTFIKSSSCGSGAGEEYIREDDELAAYSRVAKSTKIIKAKKGTGKLMDDSDEEEAEEKPVAKKAKSKSLKHIDEEEDEEDEKPVKKAAPKKAPPKKVVVEEDDEDDDKPAKKAAPKKAAVEDDDDDEEERPVKKAPPKKVAPKKAASEDDEEEEKPVKKAPPKKKAVVEEDDEEEEVKPAKKVAPKKVAKKVIVQEDDEDEE